MGGMNRAQILRVRKPEMTSSVKFARTLLVVALALFGAAAALSQQQPSKAPKATKAQKQPAKKKETPPAPPPAAPKTDFAAAMKNLRFREIGPAAMGGRIDDFAVVESDPSVVYVGTASGGVFKTTNGGTTFTPIFDDQPVSTIGDLAVAPSDPSILWVGTGESNNRQSSSWGNGIYKSTDAGVTFQHMGLNETHHIGRIIIHPTDPNSVYVAAAGKLWGPNKERGVYKTIDGGATWTQVLFINEDTGVVDLVMDTQSPGTLYAAAYQRRRTVFGFSGGGPSSAIYKTTDGGATWAKLTKDLPYADGSDSGRIGLAVYRRDPNIVYALIEHPKGGIFRSSDKGATWTKMSDTNPRPMYYSQVVIDPNNDQRIWVMGAPMYYSEDGGKTFTNNRVQRIHGDYHAMWINPANSDHMLTGSDGGIFWSYDAGRTWDFVNTIPLGQFYEIGADMKKPYNICGGLQDNNAWCGPSATMNPRGISNEEWFTVGGGDGFYAQVDPTDANTVYAESQDGNLLRRDLRTGESRSIRPQSAEGEKPYRFQWNSPIVISAHNSRTIYYGGNFFFKSTNRGDSWSKISPDLTNGVDRYTLPIMGKPVDRNTLSRNDGVQNWPAVTTIAESSFSPNILWAGTDDGNLWVTRDGAQNWKNVYDKLPGVPKGLYVSRVIASRHAEGTAYAAIDGHRSNDFGIYVYVTTDFGESWKSIASDLPQNNGTVNVIREHPRNADLLLAGTEYGAYVSFNRGAAWTRIKMNVPTVPVDDILIHPRDNDLIFGTHGRSIWVLDDITPLEQMNDAVAASDFQLFDIRPATMWRTWSNKGSSGFKYFIGPNPPDGATINFYLKAPAEKEQVKITITDKDGKMVREITCSPRPAGGEQQQPQAGGPSGGAGGGFGFGGGGQQQPCPPQAGINRVVWDLRYPSPIPPAPPGEGGGGGFGGGSGGGGFGGLAQTGFRVDPGTYAVKVVYAGKEQTKTVMVEDDPRITFTAEERAARRQALNQIGQLAAPATLAQRTIASMRTAVNNAIESWKRAPFASPDASGRPGAPRIPDNVQQAAEALLKKIDDAYPNWGTPPAETPGLGFAGPPIVVRPTPLPQRILQLAGAIEGYSAPPTADQLALIPILQKQLTGAGAVVRKLATEDLPALNKMMNDAGVPHIVVPGGGGGQRPQPSP